VGYLWPKSDQPFDGQVESDKNEDGLYPSWSGKQPIYRTPSYGCKTWALVYQQQDVSDNAIFDPVTVSGSIDGMRKAGKLVAGNPGHPRDLKWLYLYLRYGPCYVGDTAAICYAIDRSTQQEAT
jgi:hypothetical protein